MAEIRKNVKNIQQGGLFTGWSRCKQGKARPLKNAQFCSSSRKAKILTGGIY